ncbi:MAG: response regulator [Sulfurimonas sp.]|nr:response regulator [Sulfurimonas sp.]MBU3937950.1 response regulator [bacterium]MBU4023972.1 response regulator [bacterium]MBU4057913.1 response regulator [bacterium]MBU4109642.1 response regulator [bacterium]
MKVFWIIPFLFTLAFGINSQIIVGAYSLERTAVAEEIKLQNFLEKDKDFFEKNFITANHKKSESYYLVTLEPITDEEILAAALKKIKKTYKHAYALKLPSTAIEASPTLAVQTALPVENKETVTAEVSVPDAPDTNNTLTEENSTLIIQPLIAEQNTSLQTETEIKTQEIIPIKEEPLVEEKPLMKEKIAEKEVDSMDFQTILLASLTFLILLLLYFFLKKSQKKDLNNTQEGSKENNPLQEIKIEDTQESETYENSFFELKGEEEGDFGLEESEDEELQDIAIDLKKRTPRLHGKIVKQDFKEFAGTRVLIAEDNLINQKVIIGLLGDSGIEVVVANNGKEALDILEYDHNFSIIFMDVHMPIMNGFEATKFIRENPRYNHIAIIALSGDIADSDIKKMLAAGMDEHLEKPLRIDALYDILYVYTDAKDINPSAGMGGDSELNFEKGLATCSGDEEFYREILNEFLMTYADSDTKIFEYLNENNFVAADKYLLDLIGVTSHIGADKLNAVAKELKEALKDTEEKSYLTLADQYSELLQKLLQSIHEYK